VPLKNEFRVYLRALEPDDYKISVNWRNDEQIWQMVGGPKYFVSSEYEKKWVEQAIFDNSNIRLAICVKSSEKYIGNVYLTHLDWINRSAEAHIFIGDKDEWGKGYASEALFLMLQFGFLERGLERIYAYILETNIQSQKLFQKCGFQEEGMLRHSVYKDGKFQNQKVLSLLGPDFIKSNYK
jgi:RimJ/RimL family protein N-acetyltransferase